MAGIKLRPLHKARKYPKWKSFQNRSRIKRLLDNVTGRRSFRWALIFGLLVAIYSANGTSGYHNDLQNKAVIERPSDSELLAPVEKPTSFDKNEVRKLVGRICLTDGLDKQKMVESQFGPLYVETTIDPSLQRFLLDTISGDTARFIGIVAMDPYTGEILAMTGVDKLASDTNPCIENRFPAASVFKIITSGAAMEELGLGPESKLTYTGAKHTLYKSQVRKKLRGKRRVITLKDSFAQSINPIFGRLGIRLGKGILGTYADGFWFNRKPDFQFPLVPSVLTLSDQPYQWAEVASGFNRKTLISPLHGGMIVSALLNQGILTEPVFIRKIQDANGHVLYQGHTRPIGRPISADTSDAIKQMMTETIESGTCKKAFKGYGSDPVLSKLNLGGKTGSINSRVHPGWRYDWFVGYGEMPDGSNKLAIAVVVVHDTYIGIRANKIARLAIKHYFQN